MTVYTTKIGRFWQLIGRGIMAGVQPFANLCSTLLHWKLCRIPGIQKFRFDPNYVLSFDFKSGIIRAITK